MIALAAMILAGCGSPRTAAIEDASLEQGIANYIDGDLDRAESLFLKVTRESQSDADLQTAYLYLGRIYLARGDYVKAADVLSAGKALGGDVRFDEYFEEAQRHLLASPARIVQLERITRGQLAALIYDRFGERLTEGLSGGVAEAGARNQEATGTRDTALQEPLDVLRRAGVIEALPDGELHADDAVTRPAFYVIVSRLANVLGADELPRDAVYSGGYRGALGASAGVKDGEPPGDFVTGREAVDALEKLSGLVGSAKGE